MYFDPVALKESFRGDYTGSGREIVISAKNPVPSDDGREARLCQRRFRLTGENWVPAGGQRLTNRERSQILGWIWKIRKGSRHEDVAAQSSFL